MNPLEMVRNGVKSIMRRLAVVINRISGGKISPNMVTVTGLLAHVPIAWLISGGSNLLAAGLLIIFGLFDTLDGELARLQKKASPVGMFIDSSTDRIKEIILYLGMTIFLIDSGGSKMTILVLVAALGVSLLTSYLNAWGEVVLASYNLSPDHKINKTFRSGLVSFEIRMSLIIIGLASGNLKLALYAILTLGSLTVLQRFINITRRLKNV